MKFQIRGLMAALAVGMVVPSLADAGELNVTTYESLLDRIDRLEASNRNLNSQLTSLSDGAIAPEEGPVAPGAGPACGTCGDGGSCGAYGDCGACGGCGPACCGNCSQSGGTYFLYENVLVTPYFSDNTAYVKDGEGSLSDDFIEVRSFDWDMEYSPRFEIGHVSACSGMGWRARYWHFEHGEDVSVIDNASNFDFEVEPIDDPDIRVNTQDDEILNSRHDLEINVFDLEGMRRWENCDSTVTASAGLRYARIDHQARASVTNVNTGSTRETLTFQHDFEGVGPTLAFGMRRRIRCSDFGVFGNVRGSLLWGEESSSGFATDEDDRHRRQNDTAFQPVTELTLGVDYRRCLSGGQNVFLSAGWEMQDWPNGGSANGQASEDDDRTNPWDADMALMGLTIGTGIDF